MSRDRGNGSIYQRGRVWWIAYYQGTTQIRESSKSPHRRDAIALLKRRMGELGIGTFVSPEVRKLRFEDVADLVRQDYELNEKRSISRLLGSLKHLARTFAGVKAQEITTDRLQRYAVRRKAEGAANSTVAKEFAALRRGFRLALRARQVAYVPAFPTIRVHNARQGFFEPDQLEAVLAELPDYLRNLFRFAALTGWRARDEVLPLTWDRVDFTAGVARLDIGTTKNDDGRTYPFGAFPALAELLGAQRRYTDMVEAATGQVVPWVFHRFGKQIRYYYNAWRAACARAGVADRTPHDLRRTAVRALERSGVSRSVAMKLTGHKTEAIYRRYAIVSEADLREGVAKLAVPVTNTLRTQSATNDEE